MLLLAKKNPDLRLNNISVVKNQVRICDAIEYISHIKNANLIFIGRRNTRNVDLWFLLIGYS